SEADSLHSTTSCLLCPGKRTSQYCAGRSNPLARSNFLNDLDEPVSACEWLASRTVQLVDDQELIADLTAPTYTFTSTGKMVFVRAKLSVWRHPMKRLLLALIALTVATAFTAPAFAGIRDAKNKADCEKAGGV